MRGGGGGGGHDLVSAARRMSTSTLSYRAVGHASAHSPDALSNHESLGRANVILVHGQCSDVIDACMLEPPSAILDLSTS